MQSGHDHDNRLFHKGRERHNNTPPDEGYDLRGGRPHTPDDVERGPGRPVRPGGEPIERDKPSPARPREGEDAVKGEPRERRGESVER